MSYRAIHGRLGLQTFMHSETECPSLVAMQPSPASARLEHSTDSIVLCRAIATAAAKAGARTLREIAEALNARGIATAARWTVVRAVSRERSSARLGQHWVSLMNLGGAEMSAIRVRSQSGRFPGQSGHQMAGKPGGISRE